MIYKNYTDFESLHNSDNPLILYNCWNTASAKIIERVGGFAVATSSYAIADSLGYQDGEKLPFPILLHIISKISENISIPLSVDFETGYGEDYLENLMNLVKLGVVGINLEDRIIESDTYTLVQINNQYDKIKMILDYTRKKEQKIFINARTDIFLMENKHDRATADRALERCEAYKEAGAKCIFIPGLTDIYLMEYFVKKSTLPVNIMLCEDSPPISEIIRTGVKRISFGPLSYFLANKDFERRASEVFYDHK